MDKSLYPQIDSLQMHTLKLLFGPGVYKLWNRDECLYVGSAKNIMHRISHPKHSQLRLALAEATRIEFEYCPSEKFARHWEAKQILQFQPKYNRTGKLDSTRRFDG